MKKINILEPKLFKKEKKYLNDCLKYNEISTYGRFIERFENRVKLVSKAKYGVATTSGSVGLLLALKAINIKTNDMVITPSYTFAATTNSIIHCSATPLLFDIKENDMNIDLNKVYEFLKTKTYKKGNYYFHKKTKKRIFCILPVTTFSIIPNMDEVKRIAKEFNLKIIIDAASAIGATYKNTSLLNYSDLVVYSFNGNKSVTSGGGGVVVTNNKQFSKKVMLLSTNAKSKKIPYTYEDIGYNFRITNLHAAIGLGQIENLEKILYKKQKIQIYYKRNINNVNFKFPTLPTWGKNILWLNFLISNNKKNFNKLKKKFKSINYDLNTFWKPIHLQKKKLFIKGCKLNITKKIWNKVVILPSSIKLNIEDLNKVINKINSMN